MSRVYQYRNGRWQMFLGNEICSPNGLKKLGVEQVKPYITGGILIDVIGYKGVELLPNGYEVTLADVRGALARQGLKEEDIKAGDAMFFNYGWWRRWENPTTVYQNPPGIGHEVVWTGRRWRGLSSLRGHEGGRDRSWRD